MTAYAELHNHFTQTLSNVYLTAVEDAFDLLNKYKPPSNYVNNSYNNNIRTTSTRNANNDENITNSSNNDSPNHNNNGSSLGSYNTQSTISFHLRKLQVVNHLPMYQAMM